MIEVTQTGHSGPLTFDVAIHDTAFSIKSIGTRSLGPEPVLARF